MEFEPEEIGSMEVPTKVCKSCNLAKQVTSFGKINKTRRKSRCNRCIRGAAEAKKCGMPLEDYLHFSEGPCVLCGNPDTKAYFHGDSKKPTIRVCPHHQMVFRAFTHLDELNMTNTIIQNFPFWFKFLQDNNLSLFKC